MQQDGKAGYALTAAIYEFSKATDHDSISIYLTFFHLPRSAATATTAIA